MITYAETKDFTVEEIQRLFCSVHWESGNYPEQVVKGLKHSSAVISAWDGKKRSGLSEAWMMAQRWDSFIIFLWIRSIRVCTLAMN